MKKVYMITYDLNSPGQKHKKVTEVIKEQCSDGVWCSFWESSFLIRSSLSPNEILNLIQPYIDNTDRLIIIETTKNYSGWLEKEEWTYINQMY